MKPSTLPTPWLCCSGPRPVMMKACSASPSMCAACTSLAAGTPVTRSVRSGHQDATAWRTVSQPSVRLSMNAWSISRSRTAMCSSPFASAPSVPGVGCRCSVAFSAVAVSRGSDTISRPPRARCSSKYCMIGGMVSAGLLPTIRIVSAPGMSSSGNGRPRSSPSARIPAAAPDAMQNRPL